MNGLQEQQHRKIWSETYAFSSTCAFMSGGNNPGIQICYHDIWRMDLDSLEWIKMDYVIGTLADHVELSVVDDAYLYSFGMISRGSPFINTLERFTVQPPSLYRLCLEAVYRSPNMRSYI
ncbi:hypothetical protein RF11_01909 [Thelohanellus kitauei]|uniref:Kelch domain-containing protein 10 n=1 Tax=Thelohanellus kitauei TaxID=669202 RepID=A0A0C2JBW1_THEKT|nr:hypothetical protein RF11_01909 [Thelohanellus kitauei]